MQLSEPGHPFSGDQSHSSRKTERMGNLSAFSNFDHSCGLPKQPKDLVKIKKFLKRGEEK